jgi:putative flavoprotein involved in K+ transport
MTGISGSDLPRIVVIGAGQAGLAVGYHLREHGLPCVILDAGERIGDSWRRRWDSLRVFTPARYDGLPGWRFPAPGWSYPTKDDVADYLESYAARFGLDVRSGVRVERLSREDGRFVVSCGERRFEAEQVVVATGGYQAPRIPSFATDLDPGILQLHSSQYRRPAQLRDGAVLVVGAGNSGGEIAMESATAHPTWLSGRDTGQEPVRAGSWSDRLLTPPFWFLLSHVLTVRSPLGRKVRDDLSRRGLPLARVRRKDLAAAGIERVPRVTGVHDGLPLLDDGRVLEPASVVWCTGFRPDFSWIDLPVLDPDGNPVHDRGVVGSTPGLYVVGLFFLYAGTSSLIGGAGRDAAHIAAHIAAHGTGRGTLVDDGAAVDPAR